MKLIVIGDGGVGKTSLITRFCHNTFSGLYKKTLGVDFLEKTKYVPAVKTDVTFHLWDTAGQEEYRALTRKYYRGAHAAILAFSIVDKSSFDDLHTWRAMVLEECGEIPMALVQNKNDLREGRIGAEEISAQARHWNLVLFPVSVKENAGIEEVFEALATAALTQKGVQQKAGDKKATNSTGSSSHSSERLQQRLAKIERRNRVFSGCSLL